MNNANLNVEYVSELDRYSIHDDSRLVLSLTSDECEDLIRQLYRLRWPFAGPECENCGEPLQGFECGNDQCPESDNYEECPECGGSTQDGDCTNEDCPECPDYEPNDDDDTTDESER